jgi:enoyl-CoA hydratase
MGYKNIRVEKIFGNAAVTIVFNRPEVLNAMNLEMWEELHEVVLKVKADSDTKVLVLRGAGDRSFSVGMDLRKTYEIFSTAVEQVGLTIHRCCRDLMQIPQVVVCEVHGYCFGAAFELMLACDYVIATEDSVFSLPEMNVGLPCMVEAALLVSTVGLLKAKEMCYFAWKYDADKAERMGLVNEVVRAVERERRVSEIIQELNDKDATALAVQKDIIYKWLTTDLETAMQYSILAMKLCQGSPAQKAAMKAFLKKGRASVDGGC